VFPEVLTKVSLCYAFERASLFQLRNVRTLVEVLPLQ
jgi:hypothetical protein